MTTPSKIELTKSRHEQNEEYAKKLSSLLNQSAASLMDAADIAYQWRESRCWEDEFDSFPEAVCEKVRKIKKSQAYNLANAGKVRSESKDSSRLENYDNIDGLVELGKIDDIKKRDAILEKVIKAGEATAKAIKNAVKSFLSDGNPVEAKAAPKKIVDIDKTGTVIPADVLDDWRAAEAFGSEITKKISDIKCVLEGRRKDEDIITAEVTQHSIIALKDCYTSFKNIIPYAICPSCSGHGRKGCLVCKKRGFVSKFFYDTFTPSEIKDLRSKK